MERSSLCETVARPLTFLGLCQSHRQSIKAHKVKRRPFRRSQRREVIHDQSQKPIYKSHGLLASGHWSDLTSAKCAGTETDKENKGFGWLFGILVREAGLDAPTIFEYYVSPVY